MTVQEVKKGITWVTKGAHGSRGFTCPDGFRLRVVKCDEEQTVASMDKRLIKMVEEYLGEPLKS